MEHRFQVHLRGLIDLLSNHLYSGPDVFVRELLQNGVDAIRARQQLESAHAGEINVEAHARSGAPPTLMFADNGIGLTEAEVHRFLSTIGESSKRAVESGALVPAAPTDFIGQFGIGILACFLVSDEIVVITRSAHADGDGHAALEWRGRPDGTYVLTKRGTDLAAGTRVYLTCQPGAERHFSADAVRERIRHYGALLPYPIRLSAGTVSAVVNDQEAPWRQHYDHPKERAQALLGYGRQLFECDFLDAISLRADAGDLDGVAFVLPYARDLTGRPSHRVYLKNMLLSDKADNLLPNWAFFVKAVVNANDLQPMASRESFRDDEKLEAARDALGGCLRDYLVDLARNDPGRLQQLLHLHDLPLKALALEDDECYRLFAPWFLFETSQGEMMLGEYRERHDVIRYVPHLESFRQIARVAAAQGMCIINGGYTYGADLLARYADLFPEASCEAVEPSALAQSFEELSAEEIEQTQEFLDVADAVLRPFGCRADLKKFLPPSLPALYASSSEGRFLRALEQAKELSNPTWTSVLDTLQRRRRSGTPPAELCFNYANALVRQLTALRDRALLKRALQLLYVQALLLGHQPLSHRELALMNDTLLAMIDSALAGAAARPAP